MDFLDLTLTRASDNVALDEALLLAAESGESGELLRLWELPAPAVVVGSGCKLAEDVELERCAADGVPVVRRSSGGGTVLLGRGCLCYSLVLRYDRHPALEGIRPSYEWILSRVIDALGGESITQAGISDLAVGDRKFSGNAQQRKRHHLLHHGTVLYSMDSSAIERYLRLPERQPDYRGRRDHSAFLRTLEVSRDEICSGLRRVWGATTPRGAIPADAVARLVREKYDDPDWTARR